MLPRFSAFLVWAMVAATLLFWGLRLFVRSPPAPAYAVAVDENAAVHGGDLTRLLGSAPVPVVGAVAMAPEAGARFKLLGIMATKASAAAPQGVALIAVDGKPARAFTVGTHLDDQLVLQSVSMRSAAIGPAHGPSALVLDMALLPSAATGNLPPIGGAPVPAARFVPPAAYPVTGVPVQANPVPNFSAQGIPAQQMPMQGGAPPPSGFRQNQSAPSD